MRTRTTVLVAVASCLFLAKAFHNVYSVFSTSWSEGTLLVHGEPVPLAPASGPSVTAASFGKVATSSNRAHAERAIGDRLDRATATGGTVQELCLSGDAESCRIYEADKRQTCEDGNLTDCAVLGWLHFDGVPGIPPNPSVALGFFESSCKQGGQKSCTALGRIYRDGKSVVAVNEQKAASYFERNCKEGQTADCYELGLLYQSNPQMASVGKVTQLMQQGCDRDYLPACKWMVENYQNQSVAELSGK